MLRADSLLPSRRIGSLSSLCGQLPGRGLEIRIGEAREKVNGASVTSTFFREAMALPMVGRLFLDKEYQVADARVVVIAASLRQRRFGRDPALIGRTLSVNQQQRTVVGVLPKTFQFPTDAELWIPHSQ